LDAFTRNLTELEATRKERDWYKKEYEDFRALTVGLTDSDPEIKEEVEDVVEEEPDKSVSSAPISDPCSLMYQDLSAGTYFDQIAAKTCPPPSPCADQQQDTETQNRPGSVLPPEVEQADTPHGFGIVVI